MASREVEPNRPWKLAPAAGMASKSMALLPLSPRTHTTKPAGVKEMFGGPIVEFQCKEVGWLIQKIIDYEE